jgi:hypothetical protein
MVPEDPPEYFTVPTPFDASPPAACVAAEACEATTPPAPPFAPTITALPLIEEQFETALHI